MYARFEPASMETKLIGHLRQCMEGWTFKPAVHQGRPVSMAMMTPFHFFKPNPPDDAQEELPGGGTIGRSRLRELREAKLALIDHLLSGPQARELRGKGWILRTDLGGNDVKTFREALESAERAFEATFPGTPPVPDAEPVTVVAFRDGLSQAQVDAFDNLRPTKYAVAGKYSADERIVYAAKGSQPTPLLADLFVHEVTHHFVDRRLAPSASVPRWASEGIAAFIEGLKTGKQSGVELGAVQRGRVSGGFTTWERAAESYVKRLKEAAKKGEIPSLGALLDGSLDDEFHGARAELMYGTSWLLVHYLVNAEGGKLRGPFQAWLKGLPGSGAPPALAAALGRPLSEIEAALPARLEAIR
jgi:hypothetical protein